VSNQYEQSLREDFRDDPFTEIVSTTVRSLGLHYSRRTRSMDIQQLRTTPAGVLVHRVPRSHHGRTERTRNQGTSLRLQDLGTRHALLRLLRSANPRRHVLQTPANQVEGWSNPDAETHPTGSGVGGYPLAKAFLPCRSNARQGRNQKQLMCMGCFFVRKLQLFHTFCTIYIHCL